MSYKRKTWITAGCALLAAAILATAGFDASSREAMAIGQQQDYFYKLAKAVAASDEVRRRDFSWIAVSELTRAYEKALEESASEAPKNQKARNKLMRWRRATSEFTFKLRRLLALMSTPAEIRLYPEATGLVVILVDNNPIIVSGPELKSTRSVKHRIADAYCGAYDCGELLGAPPAPAGHSAPAGAGTWILKKHQPARYETPDGLVFMFSNLAGRAEKQRVCEDIAKELRSLVTGLSDARRAGYFIDWSLLEVRSLAGSEESHVLLNQEGDYLRLSLPHLERTDLLRGGVLSWTRTAVDEEEPLTVVIKADRLMRPST